MKKILIILLLIFQISLAQNQGSMAGAFLRTGMGAREMGLAGATLAFTSPDAMSFFYNPAQLPLLKNKTVGFGYQFLALDRAVSHIGISLPLKPTGGLSLNWIHAGIKNLRSYNSYAEDTGEIGYGDEAFYASFSQSIKNKVYVGINFKFLWQHLGDGTDDFSYRDNGKAFDFGMLIKLPYNLSAATVLYNAGGTTKSNTNNIYEKGMEIVEKLPLYWAIGLNYKTPVENLVVEMDFITSNHGKKDIRIGGEWEYKDVFVRTGLEDDRFHAGAGFFKKMSTMTLGLDYAFVPGYVGEGVSHIFSWQFLF